MNSIIYLDNAATSWPKPASVCEAMVHYQENTGANPGRSGHRLSIEAGRIVYEARSNVAEILGIEDPLNVIFTHNATGALNLAIKGNLKPGDHVLTTGMEHNSVMRPLREMEKNGIGLSVLGCDREGFLDVAALEPAIRDSTRMFVVNHASNVTGSLAPLNEIGKITRKRGILLLVDAAQTAGSYPIDMETTGIDLLAFTGHKSLMGPQGTGGLAISENVDIEKFPSLMTGGTGSKSESEEHPGFLPDKYESGTPNTIGLAGLAAGTKSVLDEGIENIRKREMKLAEMLVTGIESIPGITVYGTRDMKMRTGTVSINIKGISQNEVGQTLDEDFGIMSRVGLHCAPQAHRTIGSFPNGTVRLSIGHFNSPEDIRKTLRAISAISKKSK
ncbi:MAG: aminotransferase class V-fold PLP-dependent enzyme [Actinobacteria bacterium]|nr:aminotransferase class V-fold PLP-dependent enzyme [Actinomycetota bacterium]